MATASDTFSAVRKQPKMPYRLQWGDRVVLVAESAEPVYGDYRTPAGCKLYIYLDRREPEEGFLYALEPEPGGPVLPRRWGANGWNCPVPAGARVVGQVFQSEVSHDQPLPDYEE